MTWNLALLQDVFMAVAGVAARLVADPQRAAAVAASDATVRHLESIAGVLHRNTQRDRQYLSRLEGTVLSHSPAHYFSGTPVSSMQAAPVAASHPCIISCWTGLL